MQLSGQQPYQNLAQTPRVFYWKYIKIGYSINYWVKKCVITLNWQLLTILNISWDQNLRQILKFIQNTLKIYNHYIKLLGKMIFIKNKLKIFSKSPDCFE